MADDERVGFGLWGRSCSILFLEVAENADQIMKNRFKKLCDFKLSNARMLEPIPGQITYLLRPIL